VSRAGYSEDLDQWSLIRWRGAVMSAIRGKRGQALLREMLAALDAMSDKRLIVRELITEQGDVCALGSVGHARGMEMSKLDPEEYESIAVAFALPEALVREIEYLNDECGWKETPEQRWARMRAWVAAQINEPAA
jgi:hypothetical protein